ncbi:MFS superfamily sulfate permease-like transporter [Sinorhizobium fredii]
MVYILRKSMYPHDALLGRIPNRDGFYKLHREPAARPVPGFGACMIQGSLLFFNTDYVRTRLLSIAEALPAGTVWLVIDASAIPQIDSTATAMIDEVQEELKKRGIALGLAELHTHARAMLNRAGVIDKIGSAMVFESIEDALAAFAARADRAAE